MLYFAFIERHPDRRYSVTLPDFPGCVTQAGSLAAIEAAAQQAVSVHLADVTAPLGEPLRSDLLPPAFDTREGYWMLVDLAPAVAGRRAARMH
jgi:predicted RNase H-like HicB family nuclease